LCTSAAGDLVADLAALTLFLAGFFGDLDFELRFDLDRDLGSLAGRQMATMKVQTQDEPYQRSLAVPFTGRGFDAFGLACSIAVSTVDDLALVSPDGFAESIDRDVIGQYLQVVTGQFWEDPTNFVDL
jgi:hypothetical protein